jgi:Mg2+/Co2+ transporter CorB
MQNLIVIILFLILTVVSILFSVSETAIIALSKIRLRHMISKGIKRAQSIQNLTSKLDKFIATILIGNNFVNIAMSAIVTAICIPLFGFNWGTVIATFITAFFVLIFCEITPKIFAAKRTEKIALFVAPFMEGMVKVFNPLSKFFIWISNFLLKMLRISPQKRLPLITEEEIKLMIEVGKGC